MQKAKNIYKYTIYIIIYLHQDVIKILGFGLILSKMIVL